MDTSIKFDDSIYKSAEYYRNTSAPSHDSKTIIKYIAPRVIKANPTNNPQGLHRCIAWANVGSNFATTAVSHGLASLIQNSKYSTMSSIHSIDGKRIIDEQRELAQVTETFGNTIVKYCTLQAHNRIHELQIQWLEKHLKENGVIVEKMFQIEMESAKKIIHETLQQKSNLEKKINEADRTTKAHDKQYEQLLAKRNTYSQDLFEFERKIAQNNAESLFLQRRIHHFNDENKFYLSRNQVLHDRKVRLRYELDEEIFAQHSLQMEFQVLENEKITKEDMHITSLDDVKKSLDITEVASNQPWKYYADQLTDEVQRMRIEFEQKLDVQREELHRNFELELYRFQVYKSSSDSAITRDNLVKLEQHQREQNDVAQQIASIHGSISETIMKIKTIEKQIISEKYDYHINAKQQIDSLYQMIRDRERQLDEAIRDRTVFKQQIEFFKERVDRYSRQKTDNYHNRPVSVQDIYSSSKLASSSILKSTQRSSLQELKYESNEQKRSLTPHLSPKTTNQSTFSQRPKYSTIMRIDEDEGTLTNFADFNIDQDCEELYRLLNNSNIDEIAIIQVLCNRSAEQRLDIRDKFKRLFKQNLNDALEKIQDYTLSKLLRILLLSPIERDCLELRRILKRPTIDEDILAEIFFSRSSKHIETMRDRYKKLYKNSIEQDIIGDRDSPSKKLFLALLKSNRPESNDIDDNEILKDARQLCEGATTWKTDGSIFVQLLCTRSNAQLRKIFASYQQFGKTDIEQATQVYTDGDLYRALMAIVRIIRNRPRFFAYELKRSLKGTATNDDHINRIIVTRCEADMVQIKNEFEQIAKKSLYDSIQMNTSGNYRRALLELLRHRIDVNSTKLKLESLNQQAGMLTNENLKGASVQWREPIERNDRNVFIKSTLERSASDQAINEKGQYEVYQSSTKSFHGQFDHNNLGKSNSLSTINATRSKSLRIDRRSFVPMPTTAENHSQLNDDAD
ncbi:unnamed protein product [Rotaria sp. Silwood2]|nr:unnamed protein product [Rotaria sp. Silwood2]CAF2930064.1 unnamed protein product [Rotaria sp. Silwood2]CAF3961837.1 unnamed protein product [Rotaria sp. Silwood2]CAF4107059.1 unnamed protein product [Rotaria sp. Silwood2]